MPQLVEPLEPGIVALRGVGHRARQIEQADRQRARHGRPALDDRGIALVPGKRQRPVQDRPGIPDLLPGRAYRRGLQARPTLFPLFLFRHARQKRVAGLPALIEKGLMPARNPYPAEQINQGMAALGEEVVGRFQANVSDFIALDHQPDMARYGAAFPILADGESERHQHQRPNHQRHQRPQG